MNRLVGTVTLQNGTGLRGVNLGVDLKSLQITVAQKTNNDFWMHKSEGIYNDGDQYVRSYAAFQTNSLTRNANDLIIRHYERNSAGTQWIVVYQAKLVSNSNGQLIFDVQVGGNSEDYQLLIDGWYE